jgi:hypothetical protein
VPPNSAGMGSKPSRSAPVSESALELLRNFQTVLIVDDSRSMKGELWKQVGRVPVWTLSLHGGYFQAGSALQKLAAVASDYDTDGLEIHFLNSPAVAKQVKVRATHAPHLGFGLI